MSNPSQTDFGFGVKLSDLWWKMKLCLCEPANAVWQEERWNASIAYNCVPEKPNVFFIQNWKRLCSWTLCVLCKGIVWPLAYSVNFFHSIIPHDAILGHVMFFSIKNAILGVVHMKHRCTHFLNWLPIPTLDCFFHICSQWFIWNNTGVCYIWIILMIIIITITIFVMIAMILMIMMMTAKIIKAMILMIMIMVMVIIKIVILIIMQRHLYGHSYLRQCSRCIESRALTHLRSLFVRPISQCTVHRLNNTIM